MACFARSASTSGRCRARALYRRIVTLLERGIAGGLAGGQRLPPSAIWPRDEVSRATVVSAYRGWKPTAWCAATSAADLRRRRPTLPARRSPGAARSPRPHSGQRRRPSAIWCAPRRPHLISVAGCALIAFRRDFQRAMNRAATRGDAAWRHGPTEGPAGSAALALDSAAAGHPGAGRRAAGLDLLTRA